MTAEPPPLDVERTLSTLTRHGVEFLLVGGVAAIAHGARRLTVDLDCVPQRTYENLDRFAQAFTGSQPAAARRGPQRCRGGAARAGAGARSHRSGDPRPDGDLDVADRRHADLPTRGCRRLRYEDLGSRASTQPLHGIAVRIAALDDIIASKEWAGRPKDHEALEELRRLAADRDGRQT